MTPLYYSFKSTKKQLCPTPKAGLPCCIWWWLQVSVSLRKCSLWQHSIGSVCIDWTSVSAYPTSVRHQLLCMNYHFPLVFARTETFYVCSRSIASTMLVRLSDWESQSELRTSLRAAIACTEQLPSFFKFQYYKCQLFALSVLLYLQLQHCICVALVCRLPFRTLYLSSNTLSGSIPPTLSTLTGLQ